MNKLTDRIGEAVSKLFPIEMQKYIFVYTPPKVGSTTLVSSLRISLNYANDDYGVIHIHDEVMLKVLSGVDNVTINEIINYLGNKGKMVFVIDIYRMPIERKISEYFEKIASYHFNNSEENINKYALERVTNRFNKLFLHLGNGDHYFEEYNIEPIEPFNFDKKCIKQVINGIIYVKLRLSDVSAWSKILTEILGKNIIISKDYDTENKQIGELYKKFKREYKIPPNYFKIIETCKYLHFYNTESEVNNYLAVWRKRVSDIEIVGYTNEEYLFYKQLYLENEHISIPLLHYIDDGCLCKLCKKKRYETYSYYLHNTYLVKKMTLLTHNDVMQESINKSMQSINKLNALNESIYKNNKLKSVKTIKRVGVKMNIL
jgi:hypothetical protein